MSSERRTKVVVVEQEVPWTVQALPAEEVVCPLKVWPRVAIWYWGLGGHCSLLLAFHIGLLLQGHSPDHGFFSRGPAARIL